MARASVGSASLIHPPLQQGIIPFLFRAYIKMMVADGWYIYTGGEAIPPGVTRVHIDESVTVIPANAFYKNLDIEEVKCHDRVKTVGEMAFWRCTSLRRVIMPGVKAIEEDAFHDCNALTTVECGKLERIGEGAFDGCKSLTSINLPSAKIIEGCAFYECTALTNVKFGKMLESISYGAFNGCTSLERITLPLKDGMITENDTFQGCENLKHVNLVEGALHDTIAYLQLEEWRNDMDREINSINQILSYTFAGDDTDDVGGKTLVIRMWISSVLGKIIHYKAQHQSLLNEAATILQSHLPNDIVIKTVLPFLELPNMNMQR
eukprot:scaffold2376_cov80-Skeletonema_marinoi.AAC.2